MLKKFMIKVLSFSLTLMMVLCCTNNYTFSEATLEGNFDIVSEAIETEVIHMEDEESILDGSEAAAAHISSASAEDEENISDSSEVPPAGISAASTEISTFSDLPSIVSAKGGIYGNKILLKTNQKLLDTVTAPTTADFRVTGSGGNISIKSVAVTSLKNEIILTLNLNFARGETVTVSYIGSSLVQQDNIPVVQPGISEADIPKDGLDFWVEADSGIEADSAGNVSSWTSKVNRIGAALPHVADQVSTTNEGGWVNPKSITLPNGVKTVHFQGKSIGTRVLSSDPYGSAPYRGPMTIFMMLQYVYKDGVSMNGVTTTAGYPFSTIYSPQPANYARRGLEMVRRNHGVPPNFTGNNFYTILSTGSSVAFGSHSSQMEVISLRTEDNNNLDSDGITPLKNIATWQNGNPVSTGSTSPIGGTTGIRGFDEIWRYSIGHRGMDYISAVMVYHTSLNDVEREIVEQYLYEKYYGGGYSIDNLTYTYGGGGAPMAGGAVTISGAVTNRSLFPQPEARLAMAAFDDGLMTDVQAVDVKNVNNRGSTTFSFTTTLPESLSNTDLSLFLWDDFDNVKALIPSVDIKVPSP